MPNLFDITAPATKVLLDEDREGTASFTVHNASGQRIERGEVVLKAEKNPQVLDWFKLKGDIISDYPAGQSHQFTVKIKVPKEAAAGDYIFHMDAFDADHSDERYVVGPEATFTVPEKEPEIPWWKKFPWWIVGVAAGVIILVVVVVLLLTRTSVVPNLRGKDLTDAEILLKAVGLKVGETNQEPSREIASGLITRSDPPAGAKIRRGTRVNLFVSAGPQKVNMPDVSGQTADAAKAALENACDPAPCLVVTIQQENSRTVPSGRAIRTIPAAGTQVDDGSNVSLIVSSGPRTVTLPNVVGQTSSAAKSALESLCSPAPCLVVATQSENSTTVPIGTVIRTVPGPNTQVNEGSTVRLIVSSGPVQVTIPNLRGQDLVDARDRLETLCAPVPCLIVRTNGVRSTLPIGTVISTSPSAGSTVNQGSIVTINFSIGNQFPIPVVAVQPANDPEEINYNFKTTIKDLKVYNEVIPLNGILANHLLVYPFGSYPADY